MFQFPNPQNSRPLGMFVIATAIRDPVDHVMPVRVARHMMAPEVRPIVDRAGHVMLVRVGRNTTGLAVHNTMDPAGRGLTVPVARRTMAPGGPPIGVREVPAMRAREVRVIQGQGAPVKVARPFANSGIP